MDTVRIKNEKKFLLMIRTLWIYSFYKFPMNHVAVLTTVIMLYITFLLLTYLIIENLYLLLTSSNFPPPTLCLW